MFDTRFPEKITMKLEVAVIDISWHRMFNPCLKHFKLVAYI
jgi:hypothetical protein